VTQEPREWDWEKDKDEYIKEAAKKFTDDCINEYIGFESWMAARAAEASGIADDKGNKDDYDRFRSYQQQHLNRTIELEKIKIERETASGARLVAIVAAFVAIPDTWLNSLLGFLCHSLVYTFKAWRTLPN